MPRFREHRGSLEASAATERPVRDFDDMVAISKELLRPFGFSVWSDVVRVRSYGGPDERIGWKAVYRVTVDTYGVLGYTDGPLEGNPHDPNP